MNDRTVPRTTTRARVRGALLVVLLVSMLTVGTPAAHAEDPLPPIQWRLTEEPGGIRWTSDGGFYEPFSDDTLTGFAELLSGPKIRDDTAIEFVSSGSVGAREYEVKNVPERAQLTPFVRLDADRRAPQSFALLEGDFNGEFGFRIVTSSGLPDGKPQTYYIGDPEGVGLQGPFPIPVFDVLLAGTFAEKQLISGVSTPLPVGQRVGGVPRTTAIELTVEGTASLAVSLHAPEGVEVPVVVTQTDDSVFQGDVALDTTMVDGDVASADKLIRDIYAIAADVPDGYAITASTCTGGDDEGALADDTLTVAIEPRQDVRCDLTVVNLDPDGDGVLGDDDACSGTPAGAVVDDTGCSIDQLVPCDGPWKNHGKYVAAHAKVADRFERDGLLSPEEADAAKQAAAASECGDRRASTLAVDAEAAAAPSADPAVGDQAVLAVTGPGIDSNTTVGVALVALGAGLTRGTRRRRRHRARSSCWPGLHRGTDTTR